MSNISGSKTYIKIVYIDDHIDEGLSEYLDCAYKVQPYQDELAHRTVVKEYKEIQFKDDDTYEKLLSNADVQDANIIVVDNYLFEEQNAKGKFTGKQFKLILQEVFPFIQTLVITQDQNLQGRHVIHKYNSRDAIVRSEQHYREEMENRLDDAISDILEFRDESKKFAQDAETDGSFLSEQIYNSLRGIIAYKDLTKSDIDTLVNAFKELKENVCNRN